MLASVANDLRRPLGVGYWRTSPGVYFACWIALTFAFFSASKSKLPGYILPSIPPLGLLVSQSVSLRVRKIIHGSRWFGITSGTVLFMLGVLAVLQTDSVYFTSVALAIVGGGLVSAALGSLRNHSLSIVFGVLVVIVAVNLGLGGTVRQTIDSSVSARYAFQTTQAVWSNYSPERVSTYKLRRSFQYGLNFYFHRELPEWSASRVQPGWVFTTRRDGNELQRLGLKCPFYGFRSAVVVCEDLGSAPSLPRSGHLQ